MILHAGDLFDENRPSRQSLYRTMELLRRYCCGDGDISICVDSDPSQFRFGAPNWEDENMNVCLPIFAIHGNHDDPTGEQKLAALDLLEVNKLLNYFGKVDNFDKIVVNPVLLRKGLTKVALYGLGNVRDERLNRSFNQDKVSFNVPLRPDGKSAESEWFNIMALHQNRFKGNASGIPRQNCIREDMLPEFLDLVVWGHEHDCNGKEQQATRSLHVVQPGSSVATSLNAGELKPKHAFIIEVHMDNFRCIPVPLRSVRPFLMEDVSLAAREVEKNSEDSIWRCLSEVVEQLLQRPRPTPQEGERFPPPELPLVRVRVDYGGGYHPISGQRFGQQFLNRVANPEDILITIKRRDAAIPKPAGFTGALEFHAEEASTEGQATPDIIFHYLSTGQHLDLIPEPDLNLAVQSFVQQSEVNPIERVVTDHIKAMVEYISKNTAATTVEEIRAAAKARTEELRVARLSESGAVQHVKSEPPSVAAAVAPTADGIEDQALQEAWGDGSMPNGRAEEPEEDTDMASVFGSMQPAKATPKAKAKGKAKSKAKAKAKAKMKAEPEPLGIKRQPPEQLAGVVKRQRPDRASQSQAMIDLDDIEEEPQRPAPAMPDSASSSLGAGRRMPQSFLGQPAAPQPKKFSFARR
mmetsp:Transcript_19819/g.50366  ORF Transcript_19819/g.50366 Transcript_19819/m.50366 type:complete len:637 (-) Transcript_19819:68-1978(-)